MIKKIDIFATLSSPYEHLNYFTKQLHDAFQMIKIESRSFVFEKKAVDKIIESPPNCTLSFNSLYPMEIPGRKQLCDLINIPHVTYLTTHPHQSLFLGKSPNSIITCMDMSSWGFLQAAGNHRLLFMPPGVDSRIDISPDKPRTIDVMFPATCIDYEEIYEMWKRKYPNALCDVLIEASNILLNDQKLSMYDAFGLALCHNTTRQKEIDMSIHGGTLFDELDAYVCGRARVALVRSIKDAKIEIIGDHVGKGGWEKYVGLQPNVTIHKGLRIDKMIEMMISSRIVLNSSPTIKHGAHERIFMGLACGALVITDENTYLTEQFDHGRALVMYSQNELEKVNECVNNYLADEQKRLKMTLDGKTIVYRSHTWEQRARDLVKGLNFLFKTVK